MALSLHRLFAREEIFPSYFVNNVLQAAVATVAENFRLAILNPTTIRVPAGSGNDVVVVAVEQKIRYRESNCDRAHPGGAAGTYDIWVVAKANDVVSVPDPNTDETDYAWDLRITAAGVPPPYVVGTVDHRRQVGTLQWDGAAITSITQTVDAIPLPTLSQLGISAFMQTLLDDVDAATALTTLGVSAFIQTLLNDANAATARGTLAAAADTHPHGEQHTWGPMNPVIGNLPAMYVYCRWSATAPEEVLDLQNIYFRTDSGTVTFKLQRANYGGGWSDITETVGTVADTSDDFLVIDESTFSDGEKIRVVITNVSGAPTNFSVTACFDRTNSPDT